MGLVWVIVLVVVVVTVPGLAVGMGAVGNEEAAWLISWGLNDGIVLVDDAVGMGYAPVGIEPVGNVAWLIKLGFKEGNVFDGVGTPGRPVGMLKTAWAASFGLYVGYVELTVDGRVGK